MIKRLSTFKDTENDAPSSNRFDKLNSTVNLQSEAERTPFTLISTNRHIGSKGSSDVIEKASFDQVAQEVSMNYRTREEQGSS